MIPVRHRVERFGAWVRYDDATLAALDRAASRRLGIEGGEHWSGEQPRDATGVNRAPLELHVAVTSRCGHACAGCYLDASPEGAHVDVAAIDAVLEAAARAGVFTVAVGGGEPLSHPAIGEIARRARHHGLVPVVTTSGAGVTSDRARTLGAFAQVNVSFEHAGGLRDASMVTLAERAIDALATAGVAVGANVVLTREAMEEAVATCTRAASLGAREIQLLRWKPPRGDLATYLAHRLDEAQVAALPDLLRRVVAKLDGRAALRIDCALVPLLSPALDPTGLARLGVLGCEAGSALMAATVEGRIAPCSFLAATEAAAPEIAQARGSASLRALLAFADALPEPCASCPIARTCRGGCRAVSAALLGHALAPDPECPRVSGSRGA